MYDTTIRQSDKNEIIPIPYSPPDIPESKHCQIEMIKILKTYQFVPACCIRHGQELNYL